MCMKYWLTAWSSLPKLAKEKSVVRSTDCLDMTIAVDWDIKHQTKQNYASMGVYWRMFDLWDEYQNYLHETVEYLIKCIGLDKQNF